MKEPSIVVIDGEHYPPVIKRAIDRLREQGEDPVIALLVGGGEKLDQVPMEIGVPVTDAVGKRETALAEAIDETQAKRVIDISDEPVLGYVDRCRLASVALWKGASYVGADFAFDPPERSTRPSFPTIAVIGTGKRTGKTAIASEVARLLSDQDLNPVIVAMGRGGPEDPEVIAAGERLTPETLSRWASEGRHAASDYIEDALTAGVPTVGTWRAGGGLAGATSFGNYEAAVRAAEQLISGGPGSLILEGSGAAIPPAQWDSGILVVNASADPSSVCGYFGLYRLLMSDLVVLTMVEDPADRRAARTRRKQLEPIETCIRNRPFGESKIVHTVFRPHPLGEISGKKVWFSTTAGTNTGEILKSHLQDAYGAEVAGISHSLNDRATLRKELNEIPDVDVVLVELKAAAVDVVTRFALDKGIEVVYAHNQPVTVGGDGDLADLVEETAALAQSRFFSATEVT